MKKFMASLILSLFSCTTAKVADTTIDPAFPNIIKPTGRTAFVIDSICGINLCRVQIQNEQTVWAEGPPFDPGTLICEYNTIKGIMWHKCL